MGVNSTVSKLNVGIEMAANIIIAVEFQFAPHESSRGGGQFHHSTLHRNAILAHLLGEEDAAGEGRKDGRKEARCLLSGFALPLHPSS